jgi:uncharacterized repeat protein (TIGR04138 family)
LNNEQQFWEALGRIQSQDSRFNLQVYPFVMEALDYTIRAIDERRHVTARELLDGFCSYARERFGLLAHEVMVEWGVAKASDVGDIVYQLVDAGVLAKQDSDKPEDFRIDYDLRGSLEEEYFE